MKSTIKKAFSFVCIMLCATVEASIVRNKDSGVGGMQYKEFSGYIKESPKAKPMCNIVRDRDLEAGIGEIQYKKSKKTSGKYIKKASKARPRSTVVRDKVLKAGTGRIQDKRSKKTSGKYIKKASKARPRSTVVRDKVLKAGTGGIQYKKFRPTGEYIEKVPKARSLSNVVRDKALKAGINEMQYKKEMSGGHNKKAPKVNSIGNVVRNKVYLKVSLGGMQYAKFEETLGGYIKKAPKASPVYNIGVGYNFSESIRADLNFYYGQIIYKASDEDLGLEKKLEQKIRTMAVFVNGYYDMRLHETIVPYLTAGVGVSRNDAKDMNGQFILDKEDQFFYKFKGKSKTNLAWNVGGGIKLDLNTCYSIDLGYRYIDLGGIQTDQDSSDISIKVGKQKLRGHQGMISLIYNF